MMTTLLAVFIGGGTGSLARHFAIIGGARMWGETFYGTLAVNALGCLIMGAFMELGAQKWNVPLEMRALIATGFLGGFTTFSTFSLDFFKLFETGRYASAAAYAGASLSLTLLAVFAGAFLVRATT